MVVAEGPANVVEKHEENDEMEDEETTPVKQGPVFSLEILKIITDAQQQHGLRHSDYQRYRGYCTRRIQRLRKTLHIPQGDRRHFKKKDVTEAHLKEEKVLLIPLMLSERCWGYAMQLRQESNTEPRKRFHLVSKLKKAIHYAEQLEALCQSELCDARSKLESQAYAAWIRGSFHFEVKAWKEAMDNFQQAQVVYEKLCSAVNDSDESIYKAKCEELVPSLRYCAYSVGDNTAIKDLKSLQGVAHGDILDTLDRLMAEARLKDGDSKREVTWRGKSFPVRPQSVCAFLVAEEEMAKVVDDPTEANIDGLERHVINCKDAIASVRDEMAKNKEGAASLQPLLTYLTYIRLNRSNQRTLLMINKMYQGDKNKPQDLIRLYELIIQNLNEMQQLTGMENDADYQAGLVAEMTTYKAYRCFYIGEALAAAKKFREALALYEKAQGYCQRGKRLPLSDKVSAAKTSCLAQAVLQAQEQSKAGAGGSSSIQSILERKQHAPKVALEDRLDEYLEDSKLASKQALIMKLPPEMKPITCKPLYFDVAMNYLSYPQVDETKADKKAGAQSSITGLVKGWWGWGGGSK